MLKLTLIEKMIIEKTFDVVQAEFCTYVFAFLFNDFLFNHCRRQKVE